MFTGNRDKHHQVVNVINHETVFWTNNGFIIPVDFRIYDIDTDGNECSTLLSFKFYGFFSMSSI